MSATKKQIAANRKNAVLSTGPKTAAGKINSAANAFKHGLSRWSSDHAPSDAVESLAAIFTPAASAPSFEAREAAAARLYLLEVQKKKLEAYERAVREAQSHRFSGVGPIDPSVAATALAKHGQVLSTLETYERRAYSRFKRAVRDLP